MSFNAVQAGYSGETYRYTPTKTQTQAARGSSFDQAGKCMQEQNASPAIGQASGKQNWTQLVDMSGQASYSYSFPSLPDGVFNAFLESMADVMNSGMSTEMSGRLLNHLLGQIQLMQKETGNECTLDLVMQVVKKALEEVDYSLAANLAQSKDLKQELDMMRSFYQSCLNKLEDLKDGSVEKVEQEKLETEEEEFDSWESFAKILEKIYHSMLRGEDPSFQIGSQSFSEKEWDRFLKKFDALEDKIRELVKERIEKQRETAEEQQADSKKLSDELLELLFEDRDKEDE